MSSQACGNLTEGGAWCLGLLGAAVGEVRMGGWRGTGSLAGLGVPWEMERTASSCQKERKRYGSLVEVSCGHHREGGRGRVDAGAGMLWTLAAGAVQAWSASWASWHGCPAQPLSPHAHGWGIDSYPRHPCPRPRELWVLHGEGEGEHWYEWSRGEGERC